MFVLGTFTSTESAATDSVAGSIRLRFSPHRFQSTVQMVKSALPKKRSLFGGSTPFFSDKSREKWGRNPFSFTAVSKGRRTGAQNLSLPSRRAKRFHFTLWAE